MTRRDSMKLSLMSLADHITDPVTGDRHGIDYIYSAPPVILASIAERTSTLRLGTAVTLLANLDPLRIAEDYATVDVLSDGRGDIIGGRGDIFPTTYSLSGHSLEESKDRFAENAQLLDEIWKGKPVHWSGRFRAPISGESLQPPPVQEAKDAMWIGGGSSQESVDLAARLGWKLMLPSAFGRPAFFEPIVHRYLEQWEAHGHGHAPEVGAAWHMFVAPDSQVARKQWEPRYRPSHEWMQRLVGQGNPAVPSHNAHAVDFDWLTTEGPGIGGG